VSYHGPGSCSLIYRSWHQLNSSAGIDRPSRIHSNKHRFRELVLRSLRKMPAKRRRDPDAEDELESGSEYLEDADELDESEGPVAVEEDASEALTQHREVSRIDPPAIQMVIRMRARAGTGADVFSIARSVVVSRPMRYSQRQRRKVGGRRKRGRIGMSLI
jgi:hypothetical protein